MLQETMGDEMEKKKRKCLGRIQEESLKQYILVMLLVILLCHPCGFNLVFSNPFSFTADLQLQKGDFFYSVILWV